jgi:hypothetical protein
MSKCVSLGLLLSLGVVGSALGNHAALAQAAVDTPTAGTAAVTAPVLPGVTTSLSLVEQLLGSSAQLEQNVFDVGNANVSANISSNISRLNSSASSSSGGATSGGSSSSASTGR